MKKLFLITENFPYGTTGENAFILSELPEIVKYYDVTVISHASEAALNDCADLTGLPSEVKVINIQIKLTWYRKLKYLIRYLCDADGIKEIGEILKSNGNYLQRLRYSVSFYALAMEDFRLIKKKKLFSADDEAIYYTYWYYYYTYGISKNRKYFPNMKVVTRVHGFDLYDEQCTVGRQPFQKIMDKNVDRIFFISEQGKSYYLNKYHFDNYSKYIVSRLGTIGIKHLPDVVDRAHGKFRLVSCSSVIPLKRVNLIVEALSELTEEIEWIHFGDGSEFGNLKELAARLLKNKSNIGYQLKGYIANQEIIQYYGNNYVHCFITTSSTEGIPVSAQEAMSFGIPIIATAVGGVPELIDGNGILMDADPNAQEVADAIRTMVHMGGQAYEELRKSSYRIWCERYDAEVNRERFIQMLETVSTMS